MILSSGDNSHVARVDPGVFLFVLISHLEWSFTHCTHLGSGMMAIGSQLQCIEIIFNLQHSIRTRRARF